MSVTALGHCTPSSQSWVSTTTRRRRRTTTAAAAIVVHYMKHQQWIDQLDLFMLLIRETGRARAIVCLSDCCYGCHSNTDAEPRCAPFQTRRLVIYACVCVCTCMCLTQSLCVCIGSSKQYDSGSSRIIVLITDNNDSLKSANSETKSDTN